MYAVTIAEPGGPDVLRWTEVPEPEPRPGEVVVEVVATAVNRADLLQRQGFYPPPAGAPPYPGLECSGRVVATTVNHVRVGDEVCALLGGGGYAQRVAVPATQLLPRPDSITLAEAGALPEVACTVWSNLIGVAHLQPGETLLVHGGGSGIGTFAIQFAKALGVHTIATARGSKHDRLRELGADVTIDYTTEDFAAHKADVILDIVGAAYLARNLDALATNGRLVVIGMQGGRKAELDMGALMAKRALVASTSLRARPPAEKAKIIQGVRAEVWPLVESRAIRPVIHATFPMSAAAEAHRLVESNEHFGKVLLVNPAA
ncbi:MAG: NAD(P)H-quinone oxidoreductase [Gemmatimonadales bacterium]